MTDNSAPKKGDDGTSICLPILPMNENRLLDEGICNITGKTQCMKTGDWCMDGSGTYTCFCDSAWHFLSSAK